MSVATLTTAPAVIRRNLLPQGLRTAHGALATHGVECELHGDPDAPLVVVLGGISATRHLRSHGDDLRPGWWEAMVGPGAGIDTRDYLVCGVDYLSDPLLPVDTEHQADLISALLDALGIARAHAVIGASYGGMVALRFGELHPHQVSRLVVLNAAHQPHPLATAWRVIQRRIVALGVAAGRDTEGMALARMLAITTYRTAEEFAERWSAPWEATDTGARFASEDYLDAQGLRFAAHCPVERFLSLSASIDRHRVDPASITVPTVLIGADSDLLVPLSQLRELRARLAAPSRLVELTSRFGHDAFLKEVAALTPHVIHALAENP